MLSNCEKMLVIPPTTNEWPQNQIDDQKVSMASSGRVMEKPNQELLQQQQEALKCPRCDSSNTKFCYYNNYSLSQPRHFCKACKRYWTRGGTLRNVPVGGGCRKNKRVKLPTSSSSAAIDTSSSAPNSNSNPPSQPPHIDIASTSNHINPLFYGLPGDMNLPFPRFNSRVSSHVDTAISGYDLQPHLNALGLGFSSGLMASEASENGYRNGFTSNHTLLSSYNSIFGSSSTSTPIMASLLSSTLQQQQQKFINGGVKYGAGAANLIQGLAPLEELQIARNSSDHHQAETVVASLKEVKVEEVQNRLGWNNGAACQYQIEHVASGLSDPSSLYWNTATAMGAWNDQTNIGSSVTSLI